MAERKEVYESVYGMRFLEMAHGLSTSERMLN